LPIANVENLVQQRRECPEVCSNQTKIEESAWRVHRLRIARKTHRRVRRWVRAAVRDCAGAASPLQHGMSEIPRKNSFPHQSPFVRMIQNVSVKYLALVRGINVGGKNPVSMADLRACLGRLPFNNVRTYIQSGNVLFESRHRDSLRLSRMIEDALTEEFGFACVVVVVTQEQLERVITQAPADFGGRPAEYLCDVVFLKPPIAARDVLSTIRLKDGVDQAFAADDVLYLQRLKEKASQSHLSKLTQHPAYKSMTIRNWRTTAELQRLIRGG
jgi:uncharacterized protein (DUF1697 family)